MLFNSLKVYQLCIFYRERKRGRHCLKARRKTRTQDKLRELPQDQHPESSSTTTLTQMDPSGRATQQGRGIETCFLGRRKLGRGRHSVHVLVTTKVGVYRAVKTFPPSCQSFLCSSNLRFIHTKIVNFFLLVSAACRNWYGRHGMSLSSWWEVTPPSSAVNNGWINCGTPHNLVLGTFSFTNGVELSSRKIVVPGLTGPDDIDARTLMLDLLVETFRINQREQRTVRATSRHPCISLVDFPGLHNKLLSDGR